MADRWIQFTGYILQLSDSHPSKVALNWIPQVCERPRGCPKMTWCITIKEKEKKHQLVLGSVTSPKSIDGEENCGSLLCNNWGKKGARYTGMVKF